MNPLVEIINFYACSTYFNHRLFTISLYTFLSVSKARLFINHISKFSCLSGVQYDITARARGDLSSNQIQTQQNQTDICIYKLFLKHNDFTHNQMLTAASKVCSVLNDSSLYR